MIAFDLAALALGAVAGVATGGLYFGGLALGIRWALRRRRPVAVLALSAALRIAALLGIGWGLAALAGHSALIGYGGAFVLVRAVLVAVARPPSPWGRAS